MPLRGPFARLGFASRRRCRTRSGLRQRALANKDFSQIETRIPFQVEEACLFLPTERPSLLRNMRRNKDQRRVSFKPRGIVLEFFECHADMLGPAAGFHLAHQRMAVPVYVEGGQDIDL